MLKIKELKNNLKISKLGKNIIKFNSGHISEAFTEISEKNIPDNTNYLIEWSKKHLDIIKEAQSLFIKNDIDVLTQINRGYYLHNEKKLDNDIVNIVKFWIYTYLEKELNMKKIYKKQLEDIFNIIDIENNYTTFEEIKEVIKDNI